MTSHPTPHLPECYDMAGCVCLADALNSPAWDINDSIATIGHHVAKLRAAGLLTPEQANTMTFLLPEPLPLPLPDLD